jgi:hypothetical protein
MFVNILPHQLSSDLIERDLNATHHRQTRLDTSDTDTSDELSKGPHPP